MRIGGPVPAGTDPDEWVSVLGAKGYSAAYCPLGPGSDGDTRARFRDAAREGDVVMAEVGAWSNPISRDPAERRAARRKCCEQLSLAEDVGARCCVNIAGSRGRSWDGPDADNLTDGTFRAIVESVREIIDEVNPASTYYTLETMPWIFPDSPDSYLELMDAVDRDRFAVHLDPVNLINSPRRYYGSSGLLQECFEKLGSRVRSCHAKDILLSERLTVHLDEVRPGLGNLDYPTYLAQLSRLDTDTPLMMEHLSSQEEYSEALAYIRSIAGELGLEL